VLLEDKKQVALVYYKNEDAYIKRQRNVGFIRIDNSRVNVIGEYMTHKNAFEIVTEKSVYVFVPETRSVQGTSTVHAHTVCSSSTSTLIIE
jgi:hypothetical protein